jgi:hypothetical protein
MNKVGHNNPPPDPKETIQNNILRILDSNNTSLINDDLTWFLAIIEQIWIKLCETFETAKDSEGLYAV